MATVESVCADAMSLSNDAKAEVVDRLLADISAHLDPEIERAWSELAERRSEEILSGAVTPIPGPEALKRVRDRLRR